MKKYKQLTLEQRYQIYALLKAGHLRTEIGAIIGVDKSTITRELKRNRSKRSYRPQYADKRAHERRKEKAGPRIPASVWAEIEAGIKEYSSPEQVSGLRRSAGQYLVSHEWIYQHIYRDKQRGGDLHTYLRCRKKRRKRYGSYSKRGVWKNQTSIDQRPPVVAEKTRIGDWELDTVIGKGHDQAIVTMVDRKSKLLRMKKVNQKTGNLTKQAICNELNGLTVHTLTSDNGREFSEHREIATILHASFYFCHPYSSWERGLNENTNGLIRQFFPKHMKFDTITDEQIKLVEDNLNNRPRKSLGYKSPNEVFFKELEQLTRVALTA
jgi:transposase, IS30 family